jgi:hypothetical protein
MSGSYIPGYENDSESDHESNEDENLLRGSRYLGRRHVGESERIIANDATAPEKNQNRDMLIPRVRVPQQPAVYIRKEQTNDAITSLRQRSSVNYLEERYLNETMTAPRRRQSSMVRYIGGNRPIVGKTLGRRSGEINRKDKTASTRRTRMPEIGTNTALRQRSPSKYIGEIQRDRADTTASLRQDRASAYVGDMRPSSPTTAPSPRRTSRNRYIGGSEVDKSEDHSVVQDAKEQIVEEDIQTQKIDLSELEKSLQKIDLSETNKEGEGVEENHSQTNTVDSPTTTSQPNMPAQADLLKQTTHDRTPVSNPL